MRPSWIVKPLGRYAATFWAGCGFPGLFSGFFLGDLSVEFLYQSVTNRWCCPKRQFPPGKGFSKRNLGFYLIKIELLEYNAEEPSGQVGRWELPSFFHGIPVVSVAATKHGLRYHPDICRESRHVEESVFLALDVVAVGNRVGCGVGHARTHLGAGRRGSPVRWIHPG